MAEFKGNGERNVQYKVGQAPEIGVCDFSSSADVTISSKIFFCYCYNDRLKVENIVENLEIEYGIPCLLDVRDFVAGPPIIDNVLSAIRNCRKTVLVLSESFCDSEWCKYEMLLGLQENITKGYTVMVPIVLEDCAIPDQITPLTCLDLSDEYFWGRFVEALTSDGPTGQNKIEHQSSNSSWRKQHQQAEKRPRLKIVSAPDGPVCTGFHTPHYPHPKSDHCIVLGVQEYEHTDDLTHHDFNEKDCEYCIKLLQVTSSTSTCLDSCSADQREVVQHLTTNSTPSFNVEVSKHSKISMDTSGQPATVSSRFYRMWDGRKHQGSDELLYVGSDLMKPWMCTYWFRFFGKARLFELTFGLFRNGKDESPDMVDSLTVEVVTRGKRPIKARSVTNSVVFGMPLIDRQGIFKKKVYKDVVKEIYQATFTGDWKEMDKRFTSIYNHFKGKSADLQIILLCQRIDAYATHVCDLKLTRHMVQKAKKLLPKAENKQLLEAKISQTLGYAYRKHGQLGKAQKHLERAYQAMMLVKPCFFRGECLYHLTILNYEALNGQTIPPDQVYKDILFNVDKSIDLMQLESKMVTAVTLRVKIKKAQILAERSRNALCYNQADTQINDHLNSAENLLQSIENCDDFQNNSLKYIECCLLQGKVSVCLGKGMFGMAKRHASHALDIAEETGFDKETIAITKILTDIQAKSAVEKIKPTLEILEDCLSDGYFGDCSSGPDEDQTSCRQCELNHLLYRKKKTLINDERIGDMNLANCNIGQSNFSIVDSQSTRNCSDDDSSNSCTSTFSLPFSSNTSGSDIPSSE